MREMTRRDLMARGFGASAALGSAGALGTLLNACGGGSGGSGGSLKANVTVQLMSDHETNSWKGLIDEYNKLGRAKVKLSTVGRTGFYEKLQTQMLAHSSTPDILQFASSYTAPYAAAGMLEPLDSYLQDHSLTPKGFDFSDYVKGARESSVYEGKIYGFPHDLSTFLLFYRSDLIDRAPTTWSEYYATAKRFTRSHNPKSPTKYGTTIQGAQGSVAPKEWLQTFWAYGGQLLDANLKPHLESAAGVKSLTERMEQFKTWKIVPPDAINYSYAETSTAFSQGLVAMCLQWNAAYPELLDPKANPKYHDKFKVALVPGGVPFIQTQVWSLNAHSPNKRAAYDFLCWSHQRKQDVAYTLGRGGEAGTPARASTLRDPQVLSKRPELKGLLDDIKTGRVLPQLAQGSKFYAQLDKAVAVGTAGQQTPAAALKQADTAIASFVKA